MTGGRRFRLVLTGLCVVAFAGCSTYPISKALREEARATTGIGFRTISQKPDAYRGQVVIWGGRIIKTVNQTNGSSVYVLQAPLDHEGWPRSEKLSQGRFIARSAGFLDPEVYRAGARITVAGELSGKASEPVGQTTYTYPVIVLREVCFWRPQPGVYAAPVSVWGWGWYGLYWPYYGGYYPPYYVPDYYYYRPPFHHHHDRD